MQICPFFFCFLFDFQTFSIYNVLFIVGCRGERTVRIRKVESSILFVSTRKGREIDDFTAFLQLF